MSWVNMVVVKGKVHCWEVQEGVCDCVWCGVVGNLHS